MKCERRVLQNKQELEDFIKILQKENVKSYLEIGCKFGGSLWYIGNGLPKGARIVAVDLPHGDLSFKENQGHLEECTRALKGKGYDAHLIIGDSTKKEIVDKVYALGPFDAVFIDANHTLPYINKDWSNYGKIGKLIAFHDIGFFRPNGLPPHKKPIEVPQFWKGIKDNYTHIEIRRDACDNGIGVLWMK